MRFILFQTEAGESNCSYDVSCMTMICSFSFLLIRGDTRVRIVIAGRYNDAMPYCVGNLINGRPHSQYTLSSTREFA